MALPIVLAIYGLEPIVVTLKTIGLLHWYISAAFIIALVNFNILLKGNGAPIFLPIH